MNLEFETNFTVLPKHTNYMYPMIFGGAFFSELDLCAAQCMNRLLHDSDCEGAVTHISEVKYWKPCYVGDLIFMQAKVVEIRKKSAKIEVRAERERRGQPGRDHVADATFVFVSIEHSNDVDNKPELLPYKPHGLTMPSETKSTSVVG